MKIELTCQCIKSVWMFFITKHFSQFISIKSVYQHTQENNNLSGKKEINQLVKMKTINISQCTVHYGLVNLRCRLPLFQCNKQKYRHFFFTSIFTKTKFDRPGSRKMLYKSQQQKIKNYPSSSLESLERN
jgi:hypothetical protein